MSDTALLLAMQSHHVSLNDQQRVSETVMLLFQVLHIASHDAQGVSESALSFFQAVPSHFVMINRKWVTLPFFMLGILIASHPMTNRR